MTDDDGVAEVANSGCVDVHAHCVPPEFQVVPAASAPLFRGFAAWSVPSALEMMDRQGVATAMLSMVFWNGLFADADDVTAARRLTRSSNEMAAEAIASHPDRFGGFACLPLPDQAWIDDKAARIQVPCLAVFGRPATDGERERLSHLPDTQIEEWPGDGHFVHLVDPGRFATRLRTFVEHCDQAG